MLPSYRFAFSLITLAVIPFTAGAASVSLMPSSINVSVGQTFDVNFVVEDIVDFANADFLVQFDPSMLTATGISAGANFPSLILGSIDNVNGSIGITRLIFASPSFTGTAVVVTYSFQATAPGTSTIVSPEPELGDSTGASFFHIEKLEATVTASSVPEPSGFLLGGAGLIALLTLRRQCSGV